MKMLPSFNTHFYWTALEHITMYLNRPFFFTQRKWKKLLIKCIFFWSHLVKAEVGSLFLMLSGKSSIIIVQHIVIQVVWKNTRLLHLCLALYSVFKMKTMTGSFRSFQRARLSIGCSRLCFLGTGNVATSWLAVETSDVPFVPKLASEDMTSRVAGDTVSRLKSNWDGPVYSAATFPATILSHGSLMQTGL